MQVFGGLALVILVGRSVILAYPAKVKALFALTAYCGATGPVLWIGHLNEPEYGLCDLCDDWAPTNHGEYKEMFCP